VNLLRQRLPLGLGRCGFALLLHLVSLVSAGLISCER
jgi:hypothetical protein